MIIQFFGKVRKIGKIVIMGTTGYIEDCELLLNEVKQKKTYFKE